MPLDRWSVILYSSNLPGVTRGEVPLSELEAKVTALTAEKIQINLWGADLTTELDINDELYAGGYYQGAFRDRDVFTLSVFSFKELRSSSWAWTTHYHNEIKRLAIRKRFKWLYFNTYPNGVDYVSAPVGEDPYCAEVGLSALDESTDPENGLHSVVMTFKKTIFNPREA